MTRGRTWSMVIAIVAMMLGGFMIGSPASAADNTYSGAGQEWYLYGDGEVYGSTKHKGKFSKSALLFKPGVYRLMGSQDFCSITTVKILKRKKFKVINVRLFVYESAGKRIRIGKKPHAVMLTGECIWYRVAN